MSDWYVYMVRCVDGTLYTGITTDPSRRIEEHNCSNRAAKYLIGRRPVELVYTETHPDRSSASIRESKIKKLSRRQKESLFLPHRSNGSHDQNQ